MSNGKNSHDSSSGSRHNYYYGKTKLESENILKGSNRSFVIYRPNVLYSDDINSLSFFSSLNAFSRFSNEPW